jgi:hypothetical protein
MKLCVPNSQAINRGKGKKNDYDGNIDRLMMMMMMG